MKITLLFLGIFALASSGLNHDLDAISQTIHQFAQGADNNDINMQSEVMEENFRVVWNDTAEGKIKVLDRATYLQLIDSKKFGGGNREVEIISIDFYEAVNAKAKVKLSQEGKPTFYTFYSLVKKNGKWLITEDLVVMR